MRLVSSMFGIGSGIFALGLAAGQPCAAQPFPIDPPEPPVTSQNEGIRELGQTAETAAGNVGERQGTRNGTRADDPLGRISNRIQNRIQNRIRNRIDPNYDPNANATAPFETAEQRARTAGARTGSR
ncbi:MAG: hypothetical protein B7Z33_12140 [Sphingomonadales bacterium 12-68-11]|nr:MAG: hypothetical protein B7Z33_12140 [Sphingomonadales bacterium 12-68-11]